MEFFTGTCTYAPPDVKYKYAIYLKGNMKFTIQDHVIFVLLTLENYN